MAPDKVVLVMDPLTIHQSKRAGCDSNCTSKQEPKKIVDRDMRAYERELWKERRRAQGDRF